ILHVLIDTHSFQGVPLTLAGTINLNLDCDLGTITKSLDEFRVEYIILLIQDLGRIVLNEDFVNHLGHRTPEGSETFTVLALAELTTTLSKESFGSIVELDVDSPLLTLDWIVLVNRFRELRVACLSREIISSHSFSFLFLYVDIIKTIIKLSSRSVPVIRDDTIPCLLEMLDSGVSIVVRTNNHAAIFSDRYNDPSLRIDPDELINRVVNRDTILNNHTRIPFNLGVWDRY